MSEEAFVISLGGKTWSIPHLPFRAIKAIQPALFEAYLGAGGASMSAESVARLERSPARSSCRSDLASDLFRRA